MKNEKLALAERHSVITSYGGLVLSLIAIVLSIISIYQTYITDSRETVQILNAEDDEYYHYDDNTETLFKNYRITVANNSSIPVSIVKIDIDRDGEVYTYSFAELKDVLPINMEENHTKTIVIPWKMLLTERQKTVLKDTLDSNDSQITTPESSALDDLLSTRYASTRSSVGRISDTGILEHSEVLYYNKRVPLVVTVYTAKGKQFTLVSEDKKFGNYSADEIDEIIKELQRRKEE